MRIYLVEYNGDPDGQQGYSFHGKIKDAYHEKDLWDKQGMCHLALVKILEIKPTKAGMLSALNALASHNNNG